MESNKERNKNDGVDYEDTTYEQLKKFVYSDCYKVEPSQNTLVSMLLESFEAILSVIAQRHWSLLVTRDPKDELICSDHPVALTWAKNSPSLWPPGWGMKNTIATVPLTKHMALVGMYEGKLGTYEIDRQGVATINSRTGMCAEQFVYSPNRTFIYIKPDGSIGDVDDLVTPIREQRK